MKGISLVYVLPLLLLVAGAGLGEMSAGYASQHDAYAASGALLGLVAGFVLARWISVRRDAKSLRPYIARQWYDE